ncbi:MAG: peptide chain release factor 1 [Nitrospirae bacterium]|nr:peptide chain release factor 1 [Nitrospirota bacterium]
MFQKLEEIEKKYEELTSLLSDPKVFTTPPEFQRYSKEQAEIAEVVRRYKEFKRLLKEIEGTEEIIADPQASAEHKKLAEGEKADLIRRKEEIEKDLKLLIIPKDPSDEKDIILEIRAGTGGEEAALFASDLFKMYTRYAEKKRWKVEVIDSNTTGIGGFKEIIASIQGKGAYSRLKFEKGVHRVQRIPVTEAGGRIHTSAATVAILPEAEEVDIKVDEKDLRVDTFCASGPGGQGVNTTYSAVRITHIPTGLVVQCQDERSQLKNKAKAMRVLRSRLLEMESEKKEKERSLDRKSQVGTGDRSERIRTYNFPQNRVTDHRIGLTLHRLESVLEGDLDEIIDVLTTNANTERLKNL